MRSAASRRDPLEIETPGLDGQSLALGEHGEPDAAVLRGFRLRWRRPSSLFLRADLDGYGFETPAKPPLFSKLCVQRPRLTDGQCMIGGA